VRARGRGAARRSGSASALASASTTSANAAGAHPSRGALQSVATAVPAHERSGAGESRPRVPSRPGQGARFPRTRWRRRAAPRRHDHRLLLRAGRLRAPFAGPVSDMRSSSCRMLRSSRSPKARTGRSDRVSSSSTMRRRATLDAESAQRYIRVRFHQKGLMTGIGIRGAKITRSHLGGDGSP